MVRLLVMLSCLGCGRIGFDPGGPPGDGVNSPFDTPPLPGSLVCSARRIELPPVAANSDLAISAVGDSHVAMWAPPGAGVSGVAIKSNDVTVNPIAFATGPVQGVAGIFRTSTTTLFATVTTNGNTLWSVPTPATATVVGGDTRAIARDPIVTDSTGSLRAWVRNDDTGIVVSYVDVDGNPAQDRTIPTGFPVVAVAAADNSDHTHISWSQDVGAPALQCRQADLDLVPMAPDIGGSDVVSDDCKNPRIDSGPGAKDAIMTVWETSGGSVEMRYHGGIDDVSAQLSPRGRAPKVRFDGIRFWVAWIDQPATGDVLRIAAVEENAAFEAVDLPGFTFVGDEAFEIVRAEAIVDLAILGPDSLTLLRTCK